MATKNNYYSPGTFSTVVSVEESRPRIDTWMTGISISNSTSTSTSDSDFNIENHNNGTIECMYMHSIYNDSPLFDGIDENNDSSNSTIVNNNNNNKEKKSVYYNPIIGFAKSQAALNSAYRQRREKYNNTPVSARMKTGKNLEHLQSLAVRNAEFC